MFDPLLFFAVLGMSYMVTDICYSLYKRIMCKK